MERVLILGCGFTGRRAAIRLRSRGAEVICAGRSGDIPFDAASGDYSPLLAVLTRETVVLHSIPTLQTGSGLHEITPALVEFLSTRPPARIVYLSTTGVYGAERRVDERTPTAPRTEREYLRVEAEQAVARGPWQSLILRPAAIYGPGRGICTAMREGRFALADRGDAYVSRIHVDDLAAITEAALLQQLEGAYPLADDEPCTSREAAQFCADLLGIPLPPETPARDLGETRRSDRRVDGSAIRRLLGVSLLYPSYRTGFPACLAEETRAP